MLENIELKEKAEYCLNCLNKPCKNACPLSNDTAGFIKYIKENKLKEAYELLCETTVLPAVCGLICPHDKQCQGSCIRAIKGEQVSIGEMEAFIGKLAIENDWKITKKCENKNKKIAVIGGGPTGLSCAGKLAKEGYSVDIYEKHNTLGGILNHGIPDFRLDKNLLQKAIQKILNLGITVYLNKTLGKDFTLEDLEEKYDAIYLGIGANISLTMGIEGENLAGVYGGNELLENNIHPDYKGKIVAINGGGNVAMDTARTIKRLGAKKVYIIYRRSEKEMPAEKKEIKEAKEEGIEFLFQNNILKILGNEKVEKIECIKTELIAKEGDNRLSPVNIEGTNHYIDLDYIVMAVGSKTDTEVVSKLGVNLDSRGRVEIDENNMTSEKGVFAGGDLTGTRATVAWAARSGRDTAEKIIEYLEK